MNTSENIKDKAISGTIWKLLERVLAQGISLAVSIVLARLLMPTDYAIVGIVTIFFNFANVIISGGLNTALIQKKDPDEKDYNSVFTLSFIVSIVLYLLLFFLAPWISQIYKQPLLVSVLRIMGISLPIYACKSIVCAYIYSSLQFRKFFFATLGGTLLSGVIGITMAINGFGAWSLVAQQMSNTIVDTLILFLVTKLKLRPVIHFSRLKKLFNYGWKILISSIIGTIYNQINPLFIGLKFSSADLSFYTKGRSFPDTVSSSITNTMSSVLFPVLSKVQDDKERMLNGTRRFMRVASFCVFPTLLGLFAVSDNFVNILLTSKWNGAAYYIRIFCVSYMFDVVAIGNCETIKALGRSDIYLKIEIIKKVAYFVVLGSFIFLSNSPRILAISVIVNTLIQIIVNSYPNSKLIGYTLKMQLSDLVPNLLISAAMCGIVYYTGRLPINGILLLILQIIVGVIVYVTINLLIKNESLIYIKSYIKNIVVGKMRN